MAKYFRRGWLIRGALFAVAGTSAFLTWRYTVQASNLSMVVSTDGSFVGMMAEKSGSLVDAAIGGRRAYSLSALPILSRTFDHVQEKYVEPGRVDPPLMYSAALDSVEALVPEVLFRREPSGKLLHVAVDTYTTALDVPALRSVGDVKRELRRVAAILDEHLDAEVELPAVEYAMINGALGTLDPHSILLPPEQSREMEVENRGEFGGLGITIAIREGRLTVEYPLEDTPAFEAGIQPDDVILRIDGTSTINMDLEEAVGLLRGGVGEPVTIQVGRDTWDAPRDVVVVRDTIKINPVEGELLDGGVGYIKIKNFHATVDDDLADLLARFKRQNMGRLTGLVLDLRHNPGGYLNQAVAVGDRFLRSGPVVITVEAGDRNREELSASASNTEPDYPIVVLTDANSASASEIVAGALKEQGRAVIVGERSFGKGSVQHLFPNSDDSRLKLTVAKYLTPNDRSIQSVGIPPDILLQPSIVSEREIGGEASGAGVEPFVSLFWRERVSREADLDKHLEALDEAGAAPAFQVRYLRAEGEVEPRGQKKDLSQDWEINFARDVLMSATGSRRAEVLAAAGAVVSRHQRAEQARIEEAFRVLDVDWSSGATQADAPLEVALDLGEDGVLRSDEETVWLRVTNTGDAPVHQIYAVSSSTVEWLDEQEFFFGRIDPGETRSWPRRLQLADGYRDEVGEVTIEVRSGDHALTEARQLVRAVGQPLPRLDYQIEVLDGGADAGGASGDGDGLVERGEVVALRMTVTNGGEGDAAEAFAKLKNRAGADLDLQVGTLDLGAIPAGESRSGEFLVEVRGEGDGALPLELTVGDNTRYDYAGVIRAGFYEFFTQRDELSLTVGQATDALARATPRIELSRAPGLLVQDARAVISGVVRDEAGIRDVIVHLGDEKIYYQGGGDGVQALPFTAEVTLAPGQNLLVIQARDRAGMTDIRSVVVWYDHTGGERLAAAELPIEGDQR